MSKIGTFPFGKTVERVEQIDRSPKRAFVLGVYASAVHARWQDRQGKTVVRALAVASEPYIFWRGENAGEIIQSIQIPPELGKLAPADRQFNGPSGLALDDLILGPLGLTRDEVWLCDLVPHSCLNPAQRRAIKRAYEPLVRQYDLPLPSVPEVPRQLAGDQRRQEILSELRESQAETLILLGDQPIRWFLWYYERRWKKLADFPGYGAEVPVEIGGQTYKVLPLAHPRQIAQLGRSSRRWFEVHQEWLMR